MLHNAHSSPALAPVVGSLGGGPTPKRDRRRTLTKIDKRLPLGKRIAELMALYASAFPAGELTPLRLERIANASQLQALAEQERGAWMRGEARCNLDELIRAERRAASAVKALGIVEAKPKAESLLARMAGGAPS